MKLELDDREVDYIAQVLAQRPWAEVNGLLMKIQQQANSPENRPPAPQVEPVQRARKPRPAPAPESPS